MDINEPGRLDWLRRGVTRAPQLRGFEPAIDPALDWLAAIPIRSERYVGPLSVVHTGITPGNLLLDEKTGRLTGILDWTDTMLGDAARDFADLVMWRGWAFTDQVLRNYRRPVEKDFREHIDRAARLISTITFTEAHAHGMEISAYVSGVRNAFAA